jgi:hypothetical protein
MPCRIQYRPAPPARDRRDLERARRAAAAARQQGRPAMEIALAQIGAAFDDAAVVNAFKLRVERSLRLGPQHPAVRARFSARAAILGGRSLDQAIVLTERAWRNERKAFQIASAFGRGSRHSLDVLAEARLILRLFRAKQMHAQFPAIIAALCDDAIALAAE